MLVGETAERAFTITNVSKFPVNFTLLSQVEGVGNVSTVRPFNLVPSEGSIKEKGDSVVKIIFQPDHESNSYFDILLIEIPNQIKPKRVYLRGWSYPRTFFAREYEPFIWKAEEQLRKRYEEPLKMLQRFGASPASG